MGFSRNIVPLFASIFIAEPRQQRIFTAIGAKSNDLASLASPKKTIVFNLHNLQVI